MDRLTQLTAAVDEIVEDSSKFFGKGNKAAGTRARKNLLELKKLAQELLVAIQDTKAGRASAEAGGENVPIPEDIGFKAKHEE